jgi:transposase-like protein
VKHGVSEPSFYAWRRELKRRDAGLTKNPPAPRPTRLLRVEVSPPQRSDDAVLIELSSGARLHIRVDQLSAVLDVLEARRC